VVIAQREHLELQLGVGKFNGVSTYEVFTSHKTALTELIVVGFKKGSSFTAHQFQATPKRVALVQPTVCPTRSRGGAASRRAANRPCSRPDRGLHRRVEHAYIASDGLV